MATVLALSSKVARGSVGLGAIVPALHAFGHDVIDLPTVLLSNHPGHGAVAGRRVDVGLLGDMVDALAGHHWLGGIDAVLTGYLPSAGHVTFAAELVRRVQAARRADGLPLVYLCDPVLGDDPKGLYIERDAAEAIRDRLLPLASIATPNRFEFGFLRDVPSPREGEPVGPFGSRMIVATSMPAEASGDLLNIATWAGGQLETRVPRRDGVPNGTGDLFAAVLLGALLDAFDVERALGLATAVVDRVVVASGDRDELSVPSLPRPSEVEPWPVTTVMRLRPSP